MSCVKRLAISKWRKYSCDPMRRTRSGITRFSQRRPRDRSEILKSIYFHSLGGLRFRAQGKFKTEILINMKEREMIPRSDYPHGVEGRQHPDGLTRRKFLAATAGIAPTALLIKSAAGEAVPTPDIATPT